MVDKITTPIGANELMLKVNEVIDAIPTDTGDLTNGAGYITGINASMIVDALTYTPYDSTNPDGFISSAAISSLTDVSLSSLSNGQGLIYDSTVGKWKNGAISQGAAWGNISGTLTLQTDLATALDGKQATITGAASSITSNNLTGSRVVVSGTDGKVTVSAITTTKLGYLTDVTSNIQSQINTVSSAIPTSTTQLTNDSGYITSVSSTDVTSALGFTPYSDANPDNFQTNVIETIKVNNAALSPSSKTVNITVPTSTTQLTNDSGYITTISSSMVTEALTYIPYDSTNPDDFQTNIIETIKVNNTALSSSTDKTVNITVPTSTSQLTNDSGFLTSADLSGYQITSNLVTSVTSAGTDSQYPSAKAVYTATNANASAIADNTSAIAGIMTLIPSAATSSNQLADQSFVNSSIATNTAYFIGTFNSVAELEAYSGTLTNNDYAFVATTDTAGNTLYDRYKYNGTSWLFEYELNNSSFTANQWAAINSGITADSKVTRSSTAAVGNSTIPVYVNSSGVVTTCKALNTAAYIADNTLVHLAGAETITGNKTFSGTVALGSNATATTPTVTSNDTTVATTKFVKDQGYKTTVTSTDVTSALGFTPYNATNPDNFQTNVIETIKVNNTALFPSSKTVDITVPTSTSQLTNDSGYISEITSSMITDALTYTPYNSTNPSGYQANVIETIKVNNTALSPSNKTIDITVPTSTTQLTNDSGFVTKSVQTIQDIQPITSNTVVVSDTISMYSLTPSSAVNDLTFQYSGTTDKSYTFELMLNMNEAQNITFNNVTWMYGDIPDLSETGVYFLAFRKIGNSSTWYGNLQGKW